MKLTNRQQQAVETKRKIIKTAFHLIKKNGYHALTIRDLCTETGISTGAFYHHFSSKQDLVNQGFAAFDEDLSDFLAEYKEHDPLKAIREIIIGQTAYVLENSKDVTKELYISQLSMENSYTIRSDRAYYQAVLHYVELAKQQGIFKTSDSPEEITQFLLRVNRGTILDWCFNDYSYDLTEKAEKDLGFLLRGLCAGF